MRLKRLPAMLVTTALFFNANTHAQNCTLTCPGAITTVADAGKCGAVVTFSATTSGTCGTVMYSTASGSMFPVGTTMVTASVAGQSCTFPVTVVDNQAPTITGLMANPNMLWPPNHKMRDIQVSYTSMDNCGVVACGLTVTSNEPQDGLGDGDTEVDWEIVSPTMVRLRAERSGLGNGRIYTITATCRDAAGNTTSASTIVTVPHDMGKGGSRKTLHAKSMNTSNYFTVQLESNGSSDKIGYQVTDAFGRVVEAKQNIGTTNTLQFGHSYRPGVYNVQVYQGSERVTLRLVK